MFDAAFGVARRRIFSRTFRVLRGFLALGDAARDAVPHHERRVQIRGRGPHDRIRLFRGEEPGPRLTLGLFETFRTRITRPWHDTTARVLPRGARPLHERPVFRQGRKSAQIGRRVFEELQLEPHERGEERLVRTRFRSLRAPALQSFAERPFFGERQMRNQGGDAPGLAERAVHDGAAARGFRARAGTRRWSRSETRCSR